MITDALGNEIIVGNRYGTPEMMEAFHMSQSAK